MLYGLVGAFNDYVDTILSFFLTTTYLYVDIFNPEGGQKYMLFGPPTT